MTLTLGPWRLGPHYILHVCSSVEPALSCVSLSLQKRGAAQLPEQVLGGLGRQQDPCTPSLHSGLALHTLCGLTAAQPGAGECSHSGCFTQSGRWQLRCWRNVGASVELTEVPTGTFLGSSLAGWALGLWWWELSVKQLAQ